MTKRNICILNSFLMITVFCSSFFVLAEESGSRFKACNNILKEDCATKSLNNPVGALKDVSLAVQQPTTYEGQAEFLKKVGEFTRDRMQKNLEILEKAKKCYQGQVDDNQCVQFRSRMGYELQFLRPEVRKQGALANDSDDVFAMAFDKKDKKLSPNPTLLPKAVSKAVNPFTYEWELMKDLDAKEKQEVVEQYRSEAKQMGSDECAKLPDVETNEDLAGIQTRSTCEYFLKKKLAEKHKEEFFKTFDKAPMLMVLPEGTVTTHDIIKGFDKYAKIINKGIGNMNDAIKHIPSESVDGRGKTTKVVNQDSAAAILGATTAVDEFLKANPQYCAAASAIEETNSKYRMAKKISLYGLDLIPLAAAGWLFGGPLGGGVAAGLIAGGATMAPTGLMLSDSVPENTNAQAQSKHFAGESNKPAQEANEAYENNQMVKGFAPLDALGATQAFKAGKQGAKLAEGAKGAKVVNTVDRDAAAGRGFARAPATLEGTDGLSKAVEMFKQPGWREALADAKKNKQFIKIAKEFPGEDEETAMMIFAALKKQEGGTDEQLVKRFRDLTSSCSIKGVH